MCCLRPGCLTRRGGPEPTTAVQDGGSLAGNESSEATSTASLGRVPGPGCAFPAFVDGPPDCPHRALTLYRPGRQPRAHGRNTPPTLDWIHDRGKAGVAARLLP